MYMKGGWQDLPQIIWKSKKIRTGSTSRICSQTRCRTRGSTPTCRAAISFLDESYFELILLLVVFLKSSPQHLTHSGLIQDENRRLVDQCHCQRKSPLLTSAQRSYLILVSMRWSFKTWINLSIFWCWFWRRWLSLSRVEICPSRGRHCRCGGSVKFLPAV